MPKESIEIQKDAGKGVENSQPSYVPGKAYSNLPRELSEGDLNSAAGLRFLLSEIDRLGNRVSELENYERDFYKVDKEKAILEEKLKRSALDEVLHGLFLTLGSIIIGLAPFFWESSKNYGICCLIIGGIMLIGGVATKFIKWK